MIAIGAILIILGVVFSVPVLTYVGVVLAVIGAVFWMLGRAGHAVGGRRVWY
jgi:nucleoside recognition membrane protein YjiH